MPQPKFQLYKHIKINGEWLPKLEVRSRPKVGTAYDSPFYVGRTSLLRP
jgi:hypothetical protein